MGLRLYVLVMVLRGLQFQASSPSHSFSIDYTDNSFLKDGVQFRYISGSIHYFRIPPAYWKDRLLKMYMSGLNAVQMVAFHPGCCQSQILPCAHLIQISCKLWTNGWVCCYLGSSPISTSMAGTSSVSRQVENEYGSYYACDYDYMRHLVGVFRAHLGDKVLLFTTDGTKESELRCGTMQGIYATVDFGLDENVTEAFEKQRIYEPRGPLVNSEYYTGWLDYWGEPHTTRSAEEVAHGLEKMLELGANVNMYMFQGGTNFGYWCGADYNNGIYNPITTSYDYDAPLSEAGDPTDKLYAIRTVISKFQALPAGPMPPPTPKFAYGYVFLPQRVALLDVLGLLSPSLPFYSSFPLTFESVKQPNGFMLYRTLLPHDIQEPVLLNASENGVHDLAYILLNGVYQGTLERNKVNGINISGHLGDTLDLLVENMGHINFGANESDFKGLIYNVTLGSTTVTDWLIYPLNIDAAVAHAWPPTAPARNGTTGPAFYTGFFTAPGITQDSFVKFPGWNKGQIWINGFNLGRFWPARGPQQTLFVPGSLLSGSSVNTIVVLELQDAPEKPRVLFVDRPLLNGTLSSTHKNTSKSNLRLAISLLKSAGVAPSKRKQKTLP